MRIFQTLFLFSALTLALSACDGKPQPIGRGYSSFKEVYKSAPGEKAKDVGYEYSAEKNITVIKDMRFAANDLADQLDQKLSFDVDELYLAPPANNAFYKSLDHLLRLALTQRGYLLSDNAEGKTKIDLVVKKDIPECYRGDTNPENPYQTVFIMLAMDAVPGQPENMDVVSGFYEVPLYGFEEQNALSAVVPACPIEQVDEIVIESLDEITTP